MKSATTEDDSASTFEGNNWKQARISFKESNTNDAELQLFLQSTSDGDDVKNECLKLKHTSENKYQQGLGGILENIDALMNLGDVAMKFAPESVGLAWMGVRTCLRAVHGDWATFQLFSGACADIIGIMISCRVYGTMYGDSRDLPKSFAELHDKVVEFIPQIYTDILEFSFAVFRYTRKKTLIRIGATMFKDVKGGFERQIDGIKASDLRMREFARTASERMMMHLQKETIHGQSTMKSQLVFLQETLDSSLKSSEAIVRHLVEQMEQERKSTRKKTPYEKAQDEYEENMGHLDATEVQYELLQENLDVLREPGTCRWIFDLEDYSKWQLSSQSSMIWISGEGGYGKSIVMSTVIEELRAQHTDDSKAVVQYFFCKAGASETSNTDQIFKTLVAQLYEKCQAFPDLLDRANEAINKGLGKEDLSERASEAVNKGLGKEDLSERASEAVNKGSGKKDKPKTIKFNFQVAYSELLRVMKRDVFLVIDALDECIDRQEEHFLQKLKAVVATSETRIRVMVCSRPKPDIGIDLRDNPEIKCEGNNRADIEKNVATQMREFPGWTASEKRYAVEQIVQKSGGQFKFVQVALEFLRKPLIRPFEPIIDRLPNGLAGSYITSWNATSPDYHELLKTALIWTLFADGSVPVPIIMDAYSRTYSIEAGIKEEEAGETEGNTPLGTMKMDLHEKQVRIAGGQFLEVSNSGRVTLRHLTVRDFFVTSEGSVLVEEQDALSRSSSKRALNADAPWTISAKQGHLEILKVLLQNLTSSAFQKRYLLPYAQGGKFSHVDWLEPSDDEESEEDEDGGWDEEEEEEIEKKEENEQDEHEKKPDNRPEENNEVGENTKDVEKNQSRSSEEGVKVEGTQQEAEEDRETITADETERAESRGRQSVQDDGRTSEKATSPHVSSVDSHSEAETTEDFTNLYTSDEPEFNDRKFIVYASESSEDDSDYWEGSDGSDGSDESDHSDEELMKVLPGARLMAKTKYRYEVTHWVYHIREAQALWSAEDQQENADWKYIWDKLLEFMCEQRPAFQAWLRLLCYHDGSIPYLRICRANPLHMAAFLGLSSFVRLLIAKGYDISQPCLDQSRFGKGLDGFLAPLDFAVCSKNVDIETVKLLVEHGADLNCANRALGGYHDFSVTPVHMTVSKRPTRDFMEYLVAHGADPSVKDGKGRTAVHHFSYEGLDPHALHLLLGACSEVDLINSVSSYDNQTPLHILVERKNDLPLALLEAYLEAKADVNIEDRNSMRPLHKLALYGNARAVKLLIEHDADIHDVDDRGQTALHAAAQSGNAQTLELLVQKGANVYLTDEKGRTPLYLACKHNNQETALYLIEKLDGQPENEINKPDNRGSTPLRVAASNGNVNVIQCLLSKTSSPAAAVNAEDETYQQNSPHKAAMKGRKAALELLIEHGGDLSLKDKNSLTPFQLCIKFWIEMQDESIPMEETLSFLIEQRAPPLSELNNLMFTAAAKGSVRIIESLIEVGVNPKVENKHGWTPAMFAQHHGQQSVVDLLSKQRRQKGKRPSGWADMGQRIAISNDKLKVRPVGPNYYGKTIVSDHPTPATDARYYFEIEIALDESVAKNTKIGEKLAIGVTTLPAILNAACLTITMQVEKKEHSFKKSYGWSATENRLHQFGGGYPYGPGRVQGKKGDVVGCGIDYVRKIVFFTDNGQRFEEKYDFTNISAGLYYPAVSIEGRYIAKANFGGRPFRWKGWKAWSMGL